MSFLSKFRKAAENLNRSSISAVALIISLNSGTAVHARPLLFSLTGDFTGSFVVDSNPTSLDPTIGKFFTLSVTNVIGNTGIYWNDSVHFRSADYGGGFEDFFSDQLYAGSELNPVFSTGSFSLDNSGGGAAQLVISEAVGAPEIDGGKLPLAALLLGLVAVIAQRKRKAMLAA